MKKLDCLMAVQYMNMKDLKRPGEKSWSVERGPEAEIKGAKTEKCHSKIATWNFSITAVNICNFNIWSKWEGDRSLTDDCEGMSVKESRPLYLWDIILSWLYLPSIWV